MVLGFKKQFVNKILDGSKIHTIRIDEKKRWKPKMKIHFATGVRTKNYNQFKECECYSIQEIKIYYPPLSRFPIILIDGKKMTTQQCYELAQKDGFKSFECFTQWFDSDFEGRIIHWTNHKY